MINRRDLLSMCIKIGRCEISGISRSANSRSHINKPLDPLSFNFYDVMGVRRDSPGKENDESFDSIAPYFNLASAYIVKDI